MSIFTRIFGGKAVEPFEDDTQSNVEEFISLIRIYYQASIVAHVGITNLSVVPEFVMYKRVMKIPTVSGKTGIAERSHIRKFMISTYNIDPFFFKDIDASIRKNCKGLRDVQNYFFQFGNFTNDLMTYLSTQAQWRLQGAMLIKSLLRLTIDSVIGKMLTKNDWSDATTARTANKLRASADHLGYGKKWIVEFAYQVFSESKKDSKKKR